jgi:hypothetical protein
MTHGRSQTSVAVQGIDAGVIASWRAGGRVEQWRGPGFEG